MRNKISWMVMLVTLVSMASASAQEKGDGQEPRLSLGGYGGATMSRMF